MHFLVFPKISFVSELFLALQALESFFFFFVKENKNEIK